MSELKLRLAHPYFERCAKGSYSNANHILFIFNRPMYRTPTRKQKADYARRERIVAAHGGYMRKPLHEELGEAPRFTEKDVSACKTLIRRTHKHLRVVSHWNGEGFHSLTVATLKEPKDG